MPDFLKEAQDLFEYTQFLRRDFHRHPELGFQEVRTAGVVARELNAMGYEISTGVAETGVVALLEGPRPGKTLLMRFDMDALPITEQTNAEYASQTPGVMHACGHDSHVAIGLTVARLLNEHKDELPGTVKLVFQPAEEGLGGADRMVAAGVLENPRPDRAIAMHVWNEQPLGWNCVAAGPVMAASETFSIRISGRGGHGAVPHLAIDPVVAAAHIVTALQTLVARNVPPTETAVVTVSAIKAGDAFNVIPPYADLQGTIRTFDPGVRTMVLERFEQIVSGVAGALNCEARIELNSITPAVINDAEVSRLVGEVIRELLPADQLVTRYATMGSEDFAYMMKEIPGTFVFVGSANAEKGWDAPHHNPRFDIDERVMIKGAAILAASAFKLLAED